MPVKSCQIDHKPGYKWGDQGKCYEYTPNDDTSKADAKKKAIGQGVAIGDLEAIGAQIQSMKGQYKFVAEKISMDFDGTLSTRKGQALWIRVGGDYVITARHNNDATSVYKITDRLNIPRQNVIFSGSNENKILDIMQRHITTHYDNNPDVVRKLPNGIGKLFRE